MTSPDVYRIGTQAYWTEVRVTGQPNGGYPPYDVTFRSDLQNWSALGRIVEVANESWTDVKIVSRHVHVEFTEWETLNYAPITVVSP